MDNFSYRKLRVYQHSKLFVISVYKMLVAFPAEEKYALSDQLRRAVISIPSNIAEGMSRTSVKGLNCFISRKGAKERKEVLLTTRGHTKHDIPYSCTFHTMASRSYAR